MSNSRPNASRSPARQALSSSLGTSSTSVYALEKLLIEVAQRGANLNIRVWSPTPNKLSRGASARIVAYEEEASRYRIEPDH